MTETITANTAPPNNITARKKRNLLESIVSNIVALLIFLAFGYIALMSVLQTSVIDPSNYGQEVILFENDDILINLLLIAGFTALVFKLNKHISFFSKVDMRCMEVGLFAFAAILGFIWIYSVTSIPSADSYNIYETASQAAQGDYTSFINGSDFYQNSFYGGYSYYNYYPFQLGFVLISEIIYRIFGTDSTMPLQAINVLCVAAAYLAVAKITKLLFKKRSIEFISIIMLAGCIQPILFCTFVYGNIIGMCCALWASYFLIKYFQTQRYIMLLPCGLLLVMSTLAKYNNMIYMIAFVIMLAVDMVKRRKWQSIAFAAAVCIAVTGSSNLVIMSYESRAGVDLASGVSQIMYLDMGLSESTRAPGWYNDIAKSLLMNNDLDVDAANAEALEDISSRLDTFARDSDYTLEFFSQKILSQWNETTFESIWVSEVKNHSSDLNGLANGVYSGSTGQFLEIYFNFYMQIIYILFASGIYFLFLNRKLNIETMLLPLVLLGGFGYHLLFEGKSQYILTYIVLLIPTAAYSLSVIVNGKYTGIKKIVGKLKEIPGQTPEEELYSEETETAPEFEQETEPEADKQDSLVLNSSAEI